VSGILVVDDSANIRTMLASYLSGEGYQVRTAADGQEALAAVQAEAPDLVILDVMMPQMDGPTFLRAFRREHNAPVILLTARVEEQDKVAGLDLGADDYITKPFGMRELTARVRAALRRAERPNGPPDTLVAPGITLARNGRVATVGSDRIDLTPTEASLLAALMSEPGRVFSRLELLTVLQGNPYDGYERTIDVHVRNLRAKIEPDARHPRFVETVYGAGYRFAADDQER
jgi:DNA-binding response OmpR family regulator